MANHAESERNRNEISSPIETSQTLTEIQRGALELASFLSNSPINIIQIETVIPSARYGVMASFVLGRIIGKDPNGDDIVVVHKTSTACVNILESSMDNMAKKKKKEHKEVMKNIKVIRNAVREESNWDRLFNTKGDN